MLGYRLTGLWWFQVDSQWIQHIYLSILPQTPLPSRLACNIEQSSLCCPAGPCWFSMLYTAVCPCPAQTPWLSLPHSFPPVTRTLLQTIEQSSLCCTQVLAGSPCYIQCFRLFDPTFSPSFCHCCCCVLFSDIHSLEETPPDTRIDCQTWWRVPWFYLYPLVLILATS